MAEALLPATDKARAASTVAAEATAKAGAPVPEADGAQGAPGQGRDPRGVPPRLRRLRLRRPREAGKTVRLAVMNIAVARSEGFGARYGERS